MLTLISMLAAFDSPLLYGPVPMKDSSVSRARLRQEIKEIESMGDYYVTERLTNAAILRDIDSAKKACDRVIRLFELTVRLYREDEDAYGARVPEENIKVLKSMKTILSTVQGKPTPDQLARLEELRKQVHPQPPPTIRFMPDTLKQILHFLQRMEDRLAPLRTL